MTDDEWPPVGEIVASHLTEPEETYQPERTLEAQARCTACDDRYLFLTDERRSPGDRAERECPDCGETAEAVVTVVYDPDEYDLVTPYGDGDINLRSTCEGCGHDYHGPMLRPCYECGSEEFDRWLDDE